ncbi:MAG: GGDEF domain-containing protein [Planctomycetota bacterium]
MALTCRGTIFDGVAAARETVYDHIFVVYSIIDSPCKQALEALRQAALGSGIHLLIEMYQEPDVIELARSAACVFDYHIYPVDISALLSVCHENISATSLPASESAKDQRIRQLEILVTQDDLTGLKNRRYVRQFLPTILKQAARQQCQVTLLLFDIDNFKHYNDSYGHAVGDKVLRQTAKLISRCCRGQDVVARLGGDEFAVIFWDTAEAHHTSEPNQDRRSCTQNHPRQVVFMAERFCKEMSEAAFEVLGTKGKGSLTISGGLATFPMDAQSPEDLFEQADQAMLEAKRSGKNRIYLVGEPA